MKTERFEEMGDDLANPSVRGLRVHMLNTGWLEAPAGVALMGAGRHPDVPGGQIRSYGWSDRIVRPDGSGACGTMIPLPAWYIEGADKRILVDTGTGTGEDVIAVLARYGMNLATVTDPEHDIRAQLDRIGITPESIDIVIQTHLHFDHVRGNELFTNATFIVNAAELGWALSPPPYGVYYYREFSSHVRSVLDQIHLIHGDYQVAPGIRIVFTGGHSPGHSIVFIDTEFGKAVLAGDAVYNYRSLEYEWPPGPVFDVAATLRAIQTLKTADIIILNHDPLVNALFPGGVIGESAPPDRTVEYMKRICTTGAFPLEQYAGSGTSEALPSKGSS